ncbi:MAG TPA: O-acetyl-ADP-ribose deacetylase [Chloroflexota bacterium]|jgi:O-acetyl-ADP-ribose deacetylase (regulator of RNase III)
MDSTTIGSATLRLVQGDITQETADAIVNAANEWLRGGGGVDGAIHHAAGPTLLAECARIGGCPEGEARITGAGWLNARHVIHTVGPVWEGGGAGEAEVLARAYRSALALAETHGVRTIVFPSISTGAYGYPEPAAARVALATILNHLRGPTSLAEVRFVLFAPTTLTNYQQALEELVVSSR